MSYSITSRLEVAVSLTSLLHVISLKITTSGSIGEGREAFEIILTASEHTSFTPVHNITWRSPICDNFVNCSRLTYRTRNQLAPSPRSLSRPQAKLLDGFNRSQRTFKLLRMAFQASNGLETRKYQLRSFQLPITDAIYRFSGGPPLGPVSSTDSPIRQNYHLLRKQLLRTGNTSTN